MARIRVPGRSDPKPPAPDLGALSELGGKAKNVQAVQVGAKRADAPPQELDGLAPDSIVELTLTTGARFYYRYDQLAQDVPRSTTRGTAGEPDTINLPVSVGGLLTRGGGEAGVIEAVRTFDVDLPAALGDVAGALAGKSLAEQFDKWLMKAPGLWRWSPETGIAAQGLPVTAQDLTGPGPLLVLIHGTASSTAGGYQYMSTSEPVTADPWRKEAMDKLKARYGERMVALDHKTLSMSPIQNALDLLAALPNEARLHLVSHSRGGMIGELLCRAQRIDGKAPFEGEFDRLQRWADARGDVDYGDALKQLQELERLLLEKQPKVERFVRVACPAAGTMLASGRLDRWLSVATSVLDLTGLGASPTYRFLKGFLLAVVKSRTDPHSVPGLEAMLPNSLLTSILNRPGIETTADLSVISGDIEGASLLAKLGVQVVDWFYGGDNDLVVDTVSMYGGVARKDHSARFFFDKGSDVSHFAYFRNRRTLDKLVDGLSRKDGEDAGFNRLEPAQEIGAFLSSRRTAGARPTVFLVPHLMGSHLAVDGKRVWIDLAAIARGDIEKLAFGNVGVTADAVAADAYGNLVQHLSGSHEVKPFAYDWRLSIIDNGNQLAGKLRDTMATSDEPMRIVAHGSGGLVALAGFFGNEQLAEDFAKRNGSRLLLLGGSLRGSVPVARLLLGHDRLVRYLGLLDLNHSEEKLAEIFGAMPGIIELLPTDIVDDLFRPAIWRQLTAEKVRPPNPDLLSRARTTLQKITALKLDKLPLVQVSGAGAFTATLEIKDESARFYMHGASGGAALPTDLPADRTWYAAAEPGELAKYAPAFEAYTDLLATGSTSRLPKQLLTAPGAPPGSFELRRDIAPVFPDAQELSAAALGYVRKPVRRERRKTELRLLHGNLAFAHWPVAVGHYEGDTLAGSEAQLDRALQGRLGRRRDLHIYPGPIGTAEIVLDRSQSPPGAVVIGLGRVGELSPGAARHVLSIALRRYALAVREADRQPSTEMGISMVPIGAGEGGIGTRDAITALLHALVQANTALENDAFTVVEIFELYEDRAIQAAHALALALESEQFRDYFSFNKLVGTCEGGRRQAAAQEDPTWWRRLQIRAEGGELKFTDLTDRARAPVSLIAAQREQVDEFVRGAVTQKDALGEFPPSVTLFELLLPTRLKEESRDDRNLVLVLDSMTAHYPWELLRRSEGKPLSIRAGMIRQLTEEYVPDRPLVTVGNKALVVGDPPTGLSELPPLKGAREEAELVAAQLAQTFEVTKRIACDDGRSSLAALLSGRWRVLHLASHGVVEFEKSGKKVTGMALENGRFFTPENVAQMGAIPEFVFLNCCYLGLVDPDAQRKAEARYHELAANIGTQFIKLGARAVIAAGWAVDDAAAKKFARSLYVKLLGGATFGEATKDARNDIYSTENNTWGAYQCYGDPAFRLIRHADGTRTSAADRAYVHVREAIVDINNVEEDAQTLAVRDPAALHSQLRSILSKVGGANPSWLDESELRVALGQAYAALGMFDEAINSYEIALQTERTNVPVRAIEQLANLRTRRAVTLTTSKAEQVINDSIALLKTLPEVDEDRRTSERWSLLGGCYKRLARVTEGKQRTDALREMSRCYRNAFERKKKGEQFLPYPLLNWLLADMLLAMLGKGKAPDDGDGLLGHTEIDDLLRHAEAEARLADATNPNFFNGVVVADVGLGRGLLRGELEDSAQQEVVEAYLRPWKRGASRLKFASVLEQMEFVIAVLGDGPKKSAARRKKLQGALEAITVRLRSVYEQALPIVRETGDRRGEVLALSGLAHLGKARRAESEPADAGSCSDAPGE
jgi:tetratricopeptide (TPR) repeat protein